MGKYFWKRSTSSSPHPPPSPFLWTNLLLLFGVWGWVRLCICFLFICFTVSGCAFWECSFSFPQGYYHFILIYICTFTRFTPCIHPSVRLRKNHQRIIFHSPPLTITTLYLGTSFFASCFPLLVLLTFVHQSLIFIQLCSESQSKMLTLEQN